MFVHMLGQLGCCCGSCILFICGVSLVSSRLCSSHSVSPQGICTAVCMSGCALRPCVIQLLDGKSGCALGTACLVHSPVIISVGDHTTSMIGILVGLGVFEPINATAATGTSVLRCCVGCVLTVVTAFFAQCVVWHSSALSICWLEAGQWF